MARAYVEIFCITDAGTVPVRKYGGCKGEVRVMQNQYKNMTKEEFLAKHPHFAEVCRDKFGVETHYYVN